jgi:hypothetical protein
MPVLDNTPLLLVAGVFTCTRQQRGVDENGAAVCAESVACDVRCVAVVAHGCGA